MGVALVMKRMVIDAVKEEQGNACCISRSFHNKSPLTSCTLSTRQSAPILKVGVPSMLQSLQIQTGL